jgi:glycosyltransferase involved in cell wall biosynthesis
MSCWHHAADILVIPTSAKEKIGAEYTSPMKLFEYMAAERPIVASDISSMREVLDETTAFFFKPNNPFLLAETLEKVIANYGESERMAERAKKIAIEKYSWKKRVKDIVAFVLN